jgi:hypothetical protein
VWVVTPCSLVDTTFPKLFDALDHMMNKDFRRQIKKKLYLAAWEHAVVQFVEALRYKPEGRRFNS